MDDQQVLRRFFSAEGRLLDLPLRHVKRRVVLDHVVQRFETGHRYSWREVDAILKAVHDDHAALRRCLVDDGLLAREPDADRGWVYWRPSG
ncbi:DUF2087 domain-containing protein [Nocardioides sp. SYSU DS0651]|uniref:DUF2087 domain-containing protein n=1 Tax=Nocardioides sp. SYSU DS0651 TaxID=3415955 RepID=UPI003F4B5329